MMMDKESPTSAAAAAATAHPYLLDLDLDDYVVTRVTAEMDCAVPPSPPCSSAADPPNDERDDGTCNDAPDYGGGGVAVGGGGGGGGGGVGKDWDSVESGGRRSSSNNHTRANDAARSRGGLSMEDYVDDDEVSEYLASLYAAGGGGQNQVVRPREGLNPFMTTLIVINYMSVGYILVPGAFATAGILLTSILLALVSFQSYMTSIFVLEACARAEWLERYVGPAAGANGNTAFLPRAPHHPGAEAGAGAAAMMTTSLALQEDPQSLPIPDTIATTTNHTTVTTTTSADDNNEEDDAERADPAKEEPAAQSKEDGGAAYDAHAAAPTASSGSSSIQHEPTSDGQQPTAAIPPTTAPATPNEPATSTLVVPHRSSADSSSRASYYGYEGGGIGIGIGGGVMDMTAQSMLSSMANSSVGGAGEDADERGARRSPYVERRAHARRRRRQQGSHVHSAGGRSIATASTWSRRSSVKIRARKFELSLLQQLFLGKWWNYLFTATAALDLYGLTWAFCSIFGAALSDQLPIASISWNYELWVLVFVLVAIPLSCTSILDQLYVQLAFLMLRLLMVLFMIVTLLVALANPDRSYFGDQVGPHNDLPLANWRGIIQATTTCVFATAFQFSVPAVGHVTNNKRVLSRIFVSAVGFVFASNLLLALLIAVYFGTYGQSSSNLNWTMYEASPFLSRYIVLFAAIDGIAVYPLIAISLGGILMGAVYGSDDMMEAELDWKRRTAFRFLASVPQAVGALFVRDLGVIALYTGIFTIVSYTIAPSMLCIASYRRMSIVRATTSTVYSTIVSEASHVKLAFGLIVVSTLLIAGVIVDSFFPASTSSSSS